MIGPRGLRLSGGQVQRASGGRWSGDRTCWWWTTCPTLDAETEARVWERVADGGFETALLVSHRTHVLDRADRVVVLDAGRVVDVAVTRG